MPVSVQEAKNFLHEAPKYVLIGLGALVVIGLMVILGIAINPNTDHGTVLKRVYSEPYDTWESEQKMCISRDDNGFCTQEITTSPAHWEHHPASWALRVRDEEGNEETLRVSESVYNGCNVGAWYPGDEAACREA